MANKLEFLFYALILPVLIIPVLASGNLDFKKMRKELIIIKLSQSETGSAFIQVPYWVAPVI